MIAMTLFMQPAFCGIVPGDIPPPVGCWEYKCMMKRYEHEYPTGYE